MTGTVTAYRPQGGTAYDMAALHMRMSALPSKREAVALLVDVAGVSRGWANRHATRLRNGTAADMADQLSTAAPATYLRRLRTLDPTGDTAAHNVDRARRARAA